MFNSQVEIKGKLWHACRKYVFKVALAEDILKYLGHGISETEAATADIHELVGKLQEEVEEFVNRIGKQTHE
mgnify:CR=1 FL=1